MPWGIAMRVRIVFPGRPHDAATNVEIRCRLTHLMP
jgi:hypothetical protein